MKYFLYSISACQNLAAYLHSIVTLASPSSTISVLLLFAAIIYAGHFVFSLCLSWDE